MQNADDVWSIPTIKLKQKYQILQGVALVSRCGLRILYIDVDFNTELSARSVYVNNVNFSCVYG